VEIFDENPIGLEVGVLFPSFLFVFRGRWNDKNGRLSKDKEACHTLYYICILNYS
jgi:hypothetical protein